MKVLNSFLLVFAFALIPVLTPESLAQQRRQPAKPVRKVGTVQNVPTFDTLIAADTYKIYVEVRGVGQLIRSNSVNELIDPVIKLADPPKEFKTLVKWLNTRADDVMTSRMLVATWATAKNVPEALVAIEFDSPEEAMKFEPQLNRFLPKVLPTPTPQASPSPAETTTSAKPEDVAAKPQYFLKQVGSLILITPSALNLKDLRPPKSRALSEEPSFRVARNRFASEQFFVYVDVNGIEKEEEDRRKQDQVEEAKRSEEEAKPAAENPVAPDSSTTEEKKPNEEEQQTETALTAVTTQDQTSTQQTGPDPMTMAVGMLANSFFGGEAKWPNAIGFGVSFEGESFDVRALMINAPGEKCDVIPIFPNLIPGAPLNPASPSILPADTELFATLSLDLPEIYAAISKPHLGGQDNSGMQTIRDTEFAGPFAEIEKHLKIKIKDDVLPLLGSEIVVSMPVNFLEDSRPPKPIPEASPSTSTGTEPKPATGPSFVIALSLKDKEAMRALLPKIVDSLGFKGASALAQTERRENTELVSYANTFSYAFIENFLILSADSVTTRHVVDSYLKHETLSSDTQFKNYTRWQPRQVQAQVYVSPALMDSYKSWANQPSTLISDQTREILSTLSLVGQPITYSLSNDGLGTLHELHVPKNLVLMAVAGMAAESNPSPLVANERAAISALYMIYNVESQYRAGEGQGNYGSLEKLVENQMVSKEMIENHGYKIQVTVLGNKFEVSAVPIDYGTTGRTSYYIDQTNILRGGDHGGAAATVDDNPIR